MTGLFKDRSSQGPWFFFQSFKVIGVDFPRVRIGDYSQVPPPPPRLCTSMHEGSTSLASASMSTITAALVRVNARGVGFDFPRVRIGVHMVLARCSAHRSPVTFQAMSSTQRFKVMRTRCLRAFSLRGSHHSPVTSVVEDAPSSFRFPFPLPDPSSLSVTVIEVVASHLLDWAIHAMWDHCRTVCSSSSPTAAFIPLSRSICYCCSLD